MHAYLSLTFYSPFFFSFFFSTRHLTFSFYSPKLLLGWDSDVMIFILRWDSNVDNVGNPKENEILRDNFVLISISFLDQDTKHFQYVLISIAINMARKSLRKIKHMADRSGKSYYMPPLTKTSIRPVGSGQLYYDKISKSYATNGSCLVVLQKGYFQKKRNRQLVDMDPQN